MTSPIPLILILTSTLVAQPAPPADQADRAPVPTPPNPPAPSAHFSSASDLLEALETADRDIRTFKARILYERNFVLQADRHVRGGNLYFQVHPAPPDAERRSRTFAVRFDWLLLDEAQRDEQQAWIFDGHWLVEKRFADKQYVAREITRPGVNIDPLRLGEGPIPIPIGQRKDDILARYTADLLPTEEGFDPDSERETNYLNHVRGAHQLHLVPLAHRLDQDDFRSIRLWYRADDAGRLLPLLSRTLDRKGDESFVLLTDVQVNKPIPTDAINIEAPPENTGWDVQIEYWRADPRDDATAPQAKADHE